MNQITKRIIALTLFLGSGAISADTTFGKTFFQNRSRGCNSADWMVGWPHLINRCDEECVYGALAVKPEWTRSFNRDEIGQFMFFNGTNVMTFGPAGAPGVDIFSRNFFLNDDFVGTIQAQPRVENFVADFQFYLGLDEWVEGLYFTIHAPINWTQWNMNLTESPGTQGTDIAANILGNTTPQASPLNSIIAAWDGQTLSTGTFPDLKQKMQTGRVNGKQSTTRIADIDVALGYNFVCNECGYFGINARAQFPTGNRPDSIFFFEPMVGNGKHFGLGAGLIGHYQFWNNCDSSFSMYLEADFYHLFGAKQTRLFDLKVSTDAQDTLENQRIGSRYLLFKRFNAGTFEGEVVFGTNILALNCKVKNNLLADVSLMFDYTRCHYNIDIGYNFWARTKDKISQLDQIVPNTYGVQGNALTTDNSTASRTTISGQFADDIEAIPVTITNDDLSIVSATDPTALSHKLFANVNYIWEICDYIPFVGIGGEVEFSGKQNNALDQWAIWIKGGFSFI